MKVMASFVFLAALALNAAAQKSLDLENKQESTLDKSGSQAVDMSEFRRSLQEWMNAYNRGDTLKLAGMYTEDAEYVSSHVAGLVADGRGRVIANFQRGIAAGGYLDAIEIESASVSCELATLLCKYKATNNGQKAAGRTLLVLKKSNGKWLIAVHMTVV